MEDCLVAAQEGRLRLQASDIDALLLGTDLLQRVATPGVELGAEIDQLVERLSNAPNLPPDASPAPPRELRPSDFLPPLQRPGDSPPAPPEPAPLRRSSDQALAEGERVLRVTADTLNKLLGLSSETLVESHWIAPFSASMLRLRRMQAGAGQALDVRAALAGQTVDARVQAALDDAQRIVEQSERELAERTAEVDEFGWRMGHLAQRLYDTALACRMRPFGDGLGGMARMVRDLGRSLGKQVRLEVEGESTQVDRDILDKLDAPLMHLLRNAVDHGIEMPMDRIEAGKPPEGLIRLSARHAAGMLLIELSDDGGGISLDRLRVEVVQRKLTNAETAARLSEAELLEFLFLSGFSTRGEVTEISGRGVGLDVVQNMVRQLRGAVRASAHRAGHAFRAGDAAVAVGRAQPAGRGAERDLRVPAGLRQPRAAGVGIRYRAAEGHQHFRFMDRQVGLVSARQILRSGEPAPAAESVCVVLVGDHERLYGIAVDRYVGERTVVVQPLDPRLGKVQDVMAGALMDDGRPLLILDVEDMLLSVQKLIEGGRLTRWTAAARWPRRAGASACWWSTIR